MKTKNSTAESIGARRETLRKIIAEHDNKGEPYTREQLLKELADKGFEIDYATLYRDRTTINRSNPWLEDMVESNYSAMQEEIYNQLLLVQDECWKNYRKVWTKCRIVTRTTPTDNVVEKCIEKNESNTKTKFLEIIENCQLVKQNLLKGENVQLAVKLVGNKVEELLDELAIVKKERDILKKKCRTIEDNK
jgi:hypothetical protein